MSIVGAPPHAAVSPLAPHPLAQRPASARHRRRPPAVRRRPGGTYGRGPGWGSAAGILPHLDGGGSW
eukprot:4163626-Alexandrium_andersonii.AAC.1